MERKTNAFILVRFCMMKPYLDSMRWAGAASRDETLAWLNEVMVLEVIWLNWVRSGFWHENYPSRLNNERGTGFWHEAFQSGLIAKKSLHNEFWNHWAMKDRTTNHGTIKAMRSFWCCFMNDKTITRLNEVSWCCFARWNLILAQWRHFAVLHGWNHILTGWC